MIEKLDAFENKSLDIGDLVSNLDGLNNALHDVDVAWKNAFLKQCGVLEDIYADALDKNLVSPQEGKVDIINVAVQDLRRLISERI